MRKTVLIAVILVAAAAAGWTTESQVDVETILAKHRVALGGDKALADVRTRVAEGTTHYEILQGGTGTMDGKATIVSEGINTRYVMKFNRADYPGEDFLTNGKKVQVYGMPKRTTLGELLYAHDALLKNGIFGGVLSTAWPLLDPKLRGGKLQYSGRKTIDGTELEELRFVPAKTSDLEMKLYFEPASGRHVLTVTTLTIEPQLIGGETMTSKQQAVRYRIEQKFSDFRDFDGLTLPGTCTTLLIADGYQTVQLRYTSKFENIQHNLQLDGRNFQMK
jgi:hypothetical protein